MNLEELNEFYLEAKENEEQFITIDLPFLKQKITDLTKQIQNEKLIREEATEQNNLEQIESSNKKIENSVRELYSLQKELYETYEKATQVSQEVDSCLIAIRTNPEIDNYIGSVLCEKYREKIPELEKEKSDLQNEKEAYETLQNYAEAEPDVKFAIDAIAKATREIAKLNRNQPEDCEEQLNHWHNFRSQYQNELFDLCEEKVPKKIIEDIISYEGIEFDKINIQYEIEETDNTILAYQNGISQNIKKEQNHQIYLEQVEEDTYSHLKTLAAENSDISFLLHSINHISEEIKTLEEMEKPEEEIVSSNWNNMNQMKIENQKTALKDAKNQLFELCKGEVSKEFIDSIHFTNNPPDLQPDYEEPIKESKIKKLFSFFHNSEPENNNPENLPEIPSRFTKIRNFFGKLIHPFKPSNEELEKIENETIKVDSPKEFRDGMKFDILKDIVEMYEQETIEQSKSMNKEDKEEER